MDIQIDFRSGLPIYVQMVEQIRKLIVSGTLKPGDQLPTVRQLATDLRVNFNTVARAYRILDEAGLISTQHGRGTYVWEAFNEENNQRIRSQNIHELAVQFIRDMVRMGYSYSEIDHVINSALEAERGREK